LQNGIYSIDEVRASEDLPPLPDKLGEAYRVPMNLAEVGVEPEPVQPPAIEPPAEDAPDEQKPTEEPADEGGTDG
jgi:hypothetical protein